MSTPYVGFSNETLDKCPPATAGDLIDCPMCKEKHELEDSDPPTMLFYRCGDRTFMAGIHGKLTMGVKADAAGEIPSESPPTPDGPITDDEIKRRPGSVVELLSCPFCAGAPRVLQKSTGFGIGCSNPNCRLRVAAFDATLETAVRMWNTRHGRTGGTQRVRVEQPE